MQTSGTPIPGPPTISGPLSPSTKLFGQDPDHPLPPECCLLGCKYVSICGPVCVWLVPHPPVWHRFLIVEYDGVVPSQEVETWKKVIENYHGSVSPNLNAKVGWISWPTILHAWTSRFSKHNIDVWTIGISKCLLFYCPRSPGFIFVHQCLLRNNGDMAAETKIDVAWTNFEFPWASPLRIVHMARLFSWCHLDTFLC